MGIRLGKWTHKVADHNFGRDICIFAASPSQSAILSARNLGWPGKIKRTMRCSNRDLRTVLGFTVVRSLFVSQLSPVKTTAAAVKLIVLQVVFGPRFYHCYGRHRAEIAVRVAHCPFRASHLASVISRARVLLRRNISVADNTSWDYFWTGWTA